MNGNTFLNAIARHLPDFTLSANMELVSLSVLSSSAARYCWDIEVVANTCDKYIVDLVISQASDVVLPDIRASNELRLLTVTDARNWQREGVKYHVHELMCDDSMTEKEHLFTCVCRDISVRRVLERDTGVVLWESKGEDSTRLSE